MEILSKICEVDRVSQFLSDILRNAHKNPYTIVYL